MPPITPSGMADWKNKLYFGGNLDTLRERTRLGAAESWLPRHAPEGNAVR